MASGTNKKLSPSVNPTAQTADLYFEGYAKCHQDPVNKVIHFIAIPLLMFSLFGLVWAIPFPHINLLGTYNGYFNWASFLIALEIYFYLKISPLISYVILFILLGFSYLVLLLLSWQATSGPSMWLVCVVLLFADATALFIGNRREGIYSKCNLNVKSVIVAPAYLLHLLFKKLGIKH